MRTALVCLLSLLAVCSGPAAISQSPQGLGPESGELAVVLSPIDHAARLADLRAHHAKAVHALTRAELHIALQNRGDQTRISESDLRRLKSAVAATQASVELAEAARRPQAVLEAAARATLDLPTSVDFVQTPLTEAIAQVAKAHGLDYYFDRKAIEEDGVELEKLTATFSFNRATLRYVLDKLLSRTRLVYEISGGVLEVTTHVVVEARLRWRVYDVYDLLAWDALERGLGPGVYDVDALVDRHGVYQRERRPRRLV